MATISHNLPRRTARRGRRGRSCGVRTGRQLRRSQARASSGSRRAPAGADGRWGTSSRDGTGPGQRVVVAVGALAQRRRRRPSAATCPRAPPPARPERRRTPPGRRRDARCAHPSIRGTRRRRAPPARTRRLSSTDGPALSRRRRSGATISAASRAGDVVDAGRLVGLAAGERGSGTRRFHQLVGARRARSAGRARPRRAARPAPNRPWPGGGRGCRSGRPAGPA